MPRPSLTPCRSPRRSVAVTAGLAALAVLALLGRATAAHADPPAVSVYPIPGDTVATRQTQITIRGVPTSRFGTITVVGSQTGAHPGVVKADSDGRGGSFIPSTRFTAGETVTVSTGLDVDGTGKGTWSFRVQTPGGPVASRPLPTTSPAKGAVWTFRTRPDLRPAALTVTHPATHAAGGGDLFLAPQNGPDQNGAELLGPAGRLVWFQPAPKGQTITDFRTQRYDGKPVLTWWQGVINASGTGRGVDEIVDSAYRPQATVTGGNGMKPDLHEFQITSAGTALMTGYEPVIVDASSTPHGSRRELVYDSVAQEIDIKTGLVLWEWDSLDHVGVGESYSPVARGRHVPWDYFHINSIEREPDGDVLISARNTDAVYLVNGSTGAIIWRLNGRRSTFRMGHGTTFEFQHDARLSRDGVTVTLFDDAGAPFREPDSRGMTIRLDPRARTATLIHGWHHSPAVRSPAEGNLQVLSNGDDLVGWGQGGAAATEFDSSGRVVFDMRFVAHNASYRAYRMEWGATPAGRPAAATHAFAGQTSVSASWNGTTTTHRWRILSGPRSDRLRAVGTYAKTHYETTIETHRRLSGYVAVQALDVHGHVQATSPAVRVG